LFILGINGSPRRRGNTYKLLEMFLNSCAAKGADTKLISLVDYDIRYCMGCDSCFIEGKCVFCEGEHEKPNVVVTTPSRVWLGVARGEVNPVTAFFKREYRVEGDWRVLKRFRELFG